MNKDKVPPSLISASPRKGESAVGVNQDIILIFNENVQANGGNVVISNALGDTQTISLSSPSTQYSLIGRTLILNPARNLLANSRYSVKIDSNAIVDLSGNQYAGSKNATALYFDTIDTLAPTLIQNSTIAKKGGIASRDNIVLTFNEEIQANKGNITLVSGNDTRTIPISDKQVTISGNVLTLNPLWDLNINSTYILHIDAQALNDKAFTPNAISAIDFNFTTIANGDKQAPILQNYTIQGSANDSVVLTFQEPIKRGKGNFTLSDGTTQFSIPVNDAQQVIVQDNKVVIHPTQKFNSEKLYTIISSKGIVADLAGNAFEAIKNTKAFIFDTHDKIPPTLTISNDSGVVAIKPILYTFTLSEASPRFTSENIVVQGGQKSTFTAVSSTIYTLLVVPNTDSTTPVTVEIPAGVLTDLAGNTNVVALKSTQRVDTLAPTVAISANKTATINSAATYKFLLSEDSQTFNAESITVTGADKGVFTPLSLTEYTLVVTPHANSTIPIVVEVAADKFTDMAGNGNIASDKTSQSVDTLPPTLVGTTPVNQSTNVAKNSNITLFFNENISAGQGNFVISNGSDTQTISVNDTTQVFVNNKILTLNPTKDFVANSEYSVTFSQSVITDKSGNAFAGLIQPTQLTFKTAPFATISKDSASQVQTFVDKLNSKALDGYLKGATVFADKNGDGIQNPDEASAITDDYGNFQLDNAIGSLIVSGGIDLSTGKAFAGTLRAPEGSTVITPLTTLQQGFIDAGQTPAQAEQSVAKAFGFDAQTVNLTAYDPIAEIVKTGASAQEQSIATQLMASSAQIANFLVTTTQVLQGAAGGADNLSQESASNSLVKSLVNRVLQDEQIGNSKVNLADTALLKAVIVEGAKEAKNLATTQQTPTFDAESFITKIDKMADTVTAVLKTAAESITTAVEQSKNGDGLALLSNMDKVSAFVQNDAGRSLQDVAVTFDIKKPDVIDNILKATMDLFTGDAALKAIENTAVDTQKSVQGVVAARAAEQAAIEKAAAEQKAINDAKIAAEQAAIEKAAAEQKAINDANAGGTYFPPSDTTAPIADFTSSTSDGSYKVGASVNITATTTEAVASGSTLIVTLNTGESVTLTAASAGTTLIGTYTVGAGKTSTDLAVTAITGGTAADAAGNLVSQTLGSAIISDQSAIVIDTTAPFAISSNIVVIDTNLDSTGVYANADKLRITFSEPVSTSLAINDLSLSDAHSFGTDATLSPVSASGGYATSFDVTLGTSPTLIATDVLTVAATKVIDSASNNNSNGINFNVPIIIAPNITSTTTYLLGGIPFTDNKTPTLSITAEANSAVMVFDQGVFIGMASGTINSSSYSFTPSADLWVGKHSFTFKTVVSDHIETLAHAYDLYVGNYDSSHNILFTVDRTSPYFQDIQLSSNFTNYNFKIGGLNDISGYDKITYEYIDQNYSAHGKKQSQANLTSLSISPANEFTQPVQATDSTTVNSAINTWDVGTLTNSYDFKLKLKGTESNPDQLLYTSDLLQVNVIPTKPTVDSTAPTQPNVTKNNGILSITAEALSKVLVFDNNTYIGLATETGLTEVYTFSNFSSLSGSHHINVVAIDNAGNVSTPAIIEIIGS